MKCYCALMTREAQSNLHISGGIYSNSESFILVYHSQSNINIIIINTYVFCISAYQSKPKDKRKYIPNMINVLDAYYIL